MTASEKYLAGIDALLPAIRAEAAEVERRGAISAEKMARLTGADVFRAVQPRQYGGLELDPGTFLGFR